ncbi:hypothetical protein AYL99_03088 [Fonsecaea erecta]|uniref:Structural maintenance of chromosomes protein 5 n=1 Tax=Fonsecaea erecta TaxID=1367422 RepID=A0A178ZWR1_9EURO|nr:hypothetical protein AYL99_03088 [Fonsecaea erecta]OAP63861.1 hypothetical protein AYL99_03088 [Fonsecaea erecta]
MSSRRVRRPRPSDLDDEGSRPDTPNSTAPHDSKRSRRHLSHVEDYDHASSTEHVYSLLGVGGGAHPERGYRTGAIVSVKLTNFVTYGSVTFTPGPTLNMVIGPNGTGKSTLVCAICLGLGWPPHYLGRAKDPTEYIKHGTHKAIIEIELRRSNGSHQNYYVKRVIERGGSQSKFFLNGEPCTASRIKGLAGKLDIQIDNLCQFLPQDRVVEFAQLSPIDLLTSTLRAVAEPQMITWHEELKQLRSKQKETMTNDRDMRERLANLESRQAMQISEVERMRERATVKKRLAGLEKLRPVVLLTEALKNREEEKEKITALKDEIKRLEAAVEPISESVNAQQAYETTARAYKAACEKELATAVKEGERRSRVIEQRREVMNEIDNEIQAEKRSVPENKIKQQREQMKLDDLLQKKAEIPEAFDPQALNQEIQQLRTDLRALDDRRSELDSRKADIADRVDRSNRDLHMKRNQLAGLETQAGQQAAKLEKLSRDTSKVWRWIQEHRNEFSARVYGPPLVECSLKDPRMADVVEAFMHTSDFKFITVQNQADYHLLQRQVFGTLGLHDVSLRECVSDSLDEFHPPLTGEEMKRFGLSGWALDHLQGPTIVLAQLAAERSLHKCAISSRELGQQQHDEMVNVASSYAAGKKIYSFSRRPEYGQAGTSARVSDILPARMWTEQPVDAGGQEALKREMRELKGELDSLKADAQAIDNEVEQLKGERLSLQRRYEAKQQEKAAKQQALAEWRALDPKIKSHQERIRNLVEAMRGVRARLTQLNARRDNALRDAAEAVLEFASGLRDVKSKITRLDEAKLFHAEANSDLEKLRGLQKNMLQGMIKMTAELKSHEETFNQAHDRVQRGRELLKQLKAEGQRAEADGDRSLLELLLFVRQNIDTEENLNIEIASETAKLELTEGGSVDAIAEFEKRARDIGVLKSKLEEATRLREDKRRAIQEIRGAWEPRLEAIVAKINDAFSDAFARIGCAGQVAVHKASSEYPADCTEENGGMDNGLDFANWAIHVSVKFRENEPLSLLDSHRQSGGERAVSTIFYLMALQSLSRAPFRVVDEINQGMDPRNERMVHGRIVDIATVGASQYFLITPKLLSGLTYKEGMTVLLIFSGEGLADDAKQGDGPGSWPDLSKSDLRTFLGRAQRLGMGGSA